jgi:RNA polymerase sigma factor (TIGR02999 family)
MVAGSREDVTWLLLAWSRGDDAALNELMPLVYEDPRHIARRQLKRGVCAPVVQSGTLAHEAYLRLVQARGIQCQNRGHFYALCSHMIRRILVDHARKRRYAKRGEVRWNSRLTRPSSALVSAK